MKSTGLRRLLVAVLVVCLTMGATSVAAGQEAQGNPEVEENRAAIEFAIKLAQTGLLSEREFMAQVLLTLQRTKVNPAIFWLIFHHVDH